MRSSLKILENNNIPLSQVYKDALAGQLYDQFIRSFSIYWEHLEPNEHSAIKELATFSKQKGQKTLDSPGVIDVFPPLKSKGIFKGELAGHISLFSPLFEKYVDTGTSLAKSREIPINNEIALTKIEQDLLNYLQENKGRACTYEELFANVWEHRSKSRHAIQITISRLRSKLKSSNGGQIQNESGKGYTFYQ